MGQGLVVRRDNTFVFGAVSGCPGNSIVLNRYSGELSLVDTLQKIIEADHGYIFWRLFEHVKQKKAHQADDQPDRKVLVKVFHNLSSIISA